MSLVFVFKNVRIILGPQPLGDFLLRFLRVSVSLW